MSRACQRVLLLLAILLAVLGASPRGRCEPLVADLSNHLIAITTGFTGTDLLLFGAIDGPGDVVAVIRGPTGQAIVRRMGRLFGIWVNRDSINFDEVPSFYAIASSRPLASLLTPQTAQRYGIGLDNLGIQPPDDASSTEAADMLAALIRIKIRENLFRPDPGKVIFLGGQLFRADFHFPANVPTGSYLVQVLLLRGGKVASAQTTPLIVSKVGVGADVYQFAHHRAAAYGALSIVIALFAGWMAHLAFRRA